jgi:hypothetical protein
MKANSFLSKAENSIKHGMPNRPQQHLKRKTPLLFKTSQSLAFPYVIVQAALPVLFSRCEAATIGLRWLPH